MRTLSLFSQTILPHAVSFYLSYTHNVLTMIVILIVTILCCARHDWPAFSFMKWPFIVIMVLYRKWLCLSCYHQSFFFFIFSSCTHTPHSRDILTRSGTSPALSFSFCTVWHWHACCSSSCWTILFSSLVCLFVCVLLSCHSLSLSKFIHFSKLSFFFSSLDRRAKLIHQTFCIYFAWADGGAPSTRARTGVHGRWGDARQHSIPNHLKRRRAVRAPFFIFQSRWWCGGLLNVTFLAEHFRFVATFSARQHGRRDARRRISL